MPRTTDSESVRVALSRLREETLGKAADQRLHLALDVPDSDASQDDEAADSMMPNRPARSGVRDHPRHRRENRMALRALEGGHTIPGADGYALARAGLVGERAMGLRGTADGRETNRARKGEARRTRGARPLESRNQLKRAARASGAQAHRRRAHPASRSPSLFHLWSRPNWDCALYDNRARRRNAVPLLLSEAQ